MLRRRSSIWLISLVLFFLVIHHGTYLDASAQKEQKKSFDVTVVGMADFFSGLGRQAIWIVDCLKDILKMNAIQPKTMSSSIQDASPAVKNILLESDKTPGKVAFFTDVPWYPHMSTVSLVPKESIIKIASSMFEATRLPQEWVDLLNKNFDMITVPDEWLVSVYRNSGVKKPLFVLPLGAYLENFLKINLPAKLPKPFVFGNTCTMVSRKNQAKLIEAFAQAFGNNPEVKLYLHAVAIEESAYQQVMAKIREYGLTNVVISHQKLSWSEYSKLLQSFSCYVSISMGEGYAIPAREAIALGLPLIVSDNTSHHILCTSGIARAIPSNIRVPAYYDIFKKSYGEAFDVHITDVIAALKDVYSNYTYYFAHAQKNRNWAKRYVKEGLRKKYKTIFKPEKVILGDRNSIQDGYLITNSKELYDKYRKITGQKK